MYLYACKSDEKEREREREKKSVEGNLCQEECCYLSPRSNNIISCKQILTFSVDKLCPLYIGKQNVTTKDDNNFLMFWACFFENWIFFTYLATILKTIKIFYRKKLMLFVF